MLPVEKWSQRFNKGRYSWCIVFRVIDLVDGADAIDDNLASTTSADSVNIPSEPALLATDDNVTLVENPNVHDVELHYRTLSDGTRIWVDGDTSIDTYEGWTQSNPDYRVKG